MNKFERKISGKGVVSLRKGFTLFILSENVNDISKVIKLLENSGVLIDGVTETVKYEIKKTRSWIFLSFVSTFDCFSIATSDFVSSKRYKRRS